MMDHEVQAAQELLAPWRYDVVDPTSGSDISAIRARLLPALRQTIRQSAERRTKNARARVVGAVVLGMTAAAGVALIVGVGRPKVEPIVEAQAPLEVHVTSGQVVHRTAAGDESLQPGRSKRIDPNGVIATIDDAQARLAAGGVEIGLGGRTEVGLEELGSRIVERVRLHEGSVRCVVPPLGASRQFSVVTPDATVVVHGTVFGVEVDPDPHAAPRTCVTVEDGVVTVRHRTGIVRLAAGGSWGCGDPTPTGEALEEGPPVPVTSVARTRGTGIGKVVPGSRRGSRAASQIEDLDAQNRLFRGALAAERRGEVSMAKAALRELLTRHPNSPLAAEARAMLERLEKR
ncbi:MAG: FecR domain-containing protein [Polyangiaceae bacterium]|nr:FecR domain-containing protein [Polyangiaceae bacterium]